MFQIYKTIIEMPMVEVCLSIQGYWPDSEIIQKVFNF